MIDELTKSVGKSLAEGLLGRGLAAALTFWSAGLGLLALKMGWSRAMAWLLNATPGQTVAFLIIGTLVLTSSTSAVAWFCLPALQFLEGYWPRPFTALRLAASRRAGSRVETMKQKLDQLNEDHKRTNNSATLEAKRAAIDLQRARLQSTIRSHPLDTSRCMPTRLGNLLRAAEEHPRIRYGLEILITFPRLWMVLPESARADLESARTTLDQSVQLLIWGALFLLWGVASLWALFIGMAVIFVSYYYRVIPAARNYGDLMRSIYDLYRFRLYKALHLPAPVPGDAETEHGSHLTEYLRRGIYEFPAKP